MASDPDTTPAPNNPDEQGHTPFQRDASTRTEDVLRQFQFLSDNANDPFFLMDAEARFVYVNVAACRSLGYVEEELRSLRVSDVDPLHQDAPYQALLERAQSQPIAPFETLHRRKDGMTFPVEASVNGFRIGDGPLLFCTTRDISERKAAEQALQDAHERTSRILESIADGFFALDRDWQFTYLNSQAERLLFRTREDLLGSNIWEEFPPGGAAYGREYRRAMEEQTAVSFEDFYPPFNAWYEIRAYPSEHGLSVFFQNVTERKRSEEALRASEERYRLLVEGAKDYAMILMDGEGRVTSWNTGAERILGWSEAEVLGQPPDLIFTPEDCEAGVPQQELGKAADDGRALDLRWHLKKDGSRFFADGIIECLLGEDKRLRGFAKVLRDATAQKVLEDERERLIERERNIAQQLQSALTPAVPDRIPGMALTKHYEAALEEAGVGGDFYDVFPLDKGCTALVVGDLSGKGLAAATQVATVRNMLRYALYRARTLAGALEGLNSLLTEQGLLTGFATIFVGAYDSVTSTLTYANAGQEPALVRRAATGAVEPLLPTGPVLGIFGAAAYTERTVTLSAGDTLAVFTDGLTEVGASRLEMLGIEGVAALLERPLAFGEARTAQETAALWTVRLVDGVNEFAQGGVMRDDVCLLVGVVAGEGVEG